MTDYEHIDYRLRCHTKRTDLPADVLRDIGEAYAEIIRLNRVYEALKLRLQELKNGFEGCCTACEPVAEMNKKLRKERDEARRELCAAKRELCRNEAIIRLQRHRVHRDSEDVVGLAKEIAVERGWDCFKDNP